MALATKPANATAASPIRIAAHLLGDEVGGKGVGLQTLERISGAGIFRDILDGMASESRFRTTAGQVRPFIPATVLLTAGHFRSFMQLPAVRHAIESGDYDRLREAVSKAVIMDGQTHAAALDVISGFTRPIAVRSSASCEDSSRRSPFAGTFETIFVVDNPQLPEEQRVNALLGAIKRVYLSLFSPVAIEKMQQFGLDPHEHYMSVVLQEAVGNQFTVQTSHGTLVLYLPAISAVLASRSAGMDRPEGIGRNAPFARIGFGLGTGIVASLDGGREDAIPCTVLFPDRGQVLKVPRGIPFSEGRYDSGDVLSQFLHTTQHGFDAIDMGAGIVRRLNLWDVSDVEFFTEFRDLFSFLCRGDIFHSLDFLSMRDPGFVNDSIRATFVRFVEDSMGRAVIEFLGRAARELKAQCGFDVDTELAMTLGTGEARVAFVQLRPEGVSSTAQVAISQVPQECLIAKTDDCLGHGRFELSRVVIVTEDAALDIPQAQGVISSLCSSYGSDYLLIGPNIREQIGTGGVYAHIHNPGAIVSYPDRGVSMIQPGTHSFMAVAMMHVIGAEGKDVKPVVQKIIAGGARQLCPGVYIMEKKVVVELDAEEGRGQAYFG